MNIQYSSYPCNDLKLYAPIASPGEKPNSDQIASAYEKRKLNIVKMKLYLLYILTAISNCYVIMFMWGVSAGFANYLPVVSVIASILLFVAAAPVIVFNHKWGLILGLLLSLLMMPFSVAYILGTIGDKNYHSLIALLFEIPFLLPFITAGYAGNRIVKKNFYLHFPRALISKILLSMIPIVLFVLYAISLSRYFSFV